MIADYIKREWVFFLVVISAFLIFILNELTPFYLFVFYMFISMAQIWKSIDGSFDLLFFRDKSSEVRVLVIKIIFGFITLVLSYVIIPHDLLKYLYSILIIPVGINIYMFISRFFGKRP